jgi:hypothetical protein
MDTERDLVFIVTDPAPRRAARTFTH